MNSIVAAMFVAFVAVSEPASATAAVSASAPAAATPAPASPPVPSRDSLPALAADLAAKLSDAKVRVPGGDEVAVTAVFDAARIERALATVGEAEGWPAAWLVVQDLARPWDLVLRVVLAADGQVEKPATVFATPRRAWDHDVFEAAYREAIGRKPPRERGRNLVVQTFSKRIVTEYVYDLPAAGQGAKGLMALLPEGSVVRESRAVRWSDRRLLTLAIVLVRPRFLPSACDGAAEARRDHADTGAVIAYLAGEKALEASVDLSDRFRGATGEGPIVPRYSCAPGDEDPAAAELDPAQRFAQRPLVRLIETSRSDDGRDEILVRIAGVDFGRGRREVALVRIVMRENGSGFDMSVE